MVRWVDPAVERRGIPVDSLYAETCWLPVLGPSATWLLRRLARDLLAAPDGFRLDCEVAARSLGLGGAEGRHSAFRRTLGRCIRYGLARAQGEGTLAVRTAVTPVPELQLARLPATVQAEHRRLLEAAVPDPVAPAAGLLARRALAAGVDPAQAEGALVALALHPALAARCVGGGRPALRSVQGAGRAMPSTSSTRVRKPKALPPLAR